MDISTSSHDLLRFLCRSRVNFPHLNYVLKVAKFDSSVYEIDLGCVHARGGCFYIKINSLYDSKSCSNA